MAELVVVGDEVFGLFRNKNCERAGGGRLNSPKKNTGTHSDYYRGVVKV
jgi:hypothetical protein